MIELEPRSPQRPLAWSDAMLDISDLLLETDFEVYVVGGAVRDAYLHLPVKDLDLVTPDDPLQLGRYIANHLDGAFYVLDAERGIARALIETSGGALVVDVARLRGVDLSSDLRDRDFTLNAIAVDLRSGMQRMIDPLKGEDDLRTRVIRRCSERSISDDPIRALRAVRQSVQFDARIEPQTLRDVRAAADQIMDTSPERVRDELFKLMGSKSPSRTLRIAHALGLLQHPLPETAVLQAAAFTDTPGVHDAWSHSLTVVEKLRAVLNTIGPERTDQTAAVFTLGMIVMALDVLRPYLQSHILHVWPEERTYAALLTFAAILHEVGADVEERIRIVSNRASQLRLSNDEKRRLVTMLRGLEDVNAVDVSNVLSIHRYWRAYGVAGVDACLLAMADQLGTMGVALHQDDWLQFLERMQTLLNVYFVRYDELVEPVMLLDGSDLINELNIEPGPIIGELLDMIREGQVQGIIQTREDALHITQTYLGADE